MQLVFFFFGVCVFITSKNYGQQKIYPSIYVKWGVFFPEMFSTQNEQKKNLYLRSVAEPKGAR